MDSNKTDRLLVEELKNAPSDLQLRSAINLGKIGRADIVKTARIREKIHTKLQFYPRYQKIISLSPSDRWGASDDIKKLWNDNKEIQEGFGGDFKIFQAYCKSIDCGPATIGF